MTARTTLFYSGEAMEPTAIRRADPTARFLARGSIACAGAALPTRFVGAVADRVWGIAVEITGDVAAGDKTPDVALDVTLDDGRMLTAALAESLLGGEPAAVLANARYWELPPAYVASLAVALDAAEEE